MPWYIFCVFVLNGFLIRLHMASFVHTLYRNIPASIPENLKTRLARQSRDLGYYGMGIDNETFFGEPLVSNATCEVAPNAVGYDYLLKEEVIVTRTLSWGFTSTIPVCPKTGSRFELLLTPKTGWSMIRLALLGANDEVALSKYIYAVEGVLEDNVTSSIAIEAQVNAFQVYINGDPYFYVSSIQYFPKTLQLIAPEVHIHHGIFRASPRPSP